MKIAVVILNWNGKKFLEKFLPVLINNSSQETEIVVADNASSDDSVEYVQKKFPEVTLIRNSENGGFAKGYNDALAHVKAEYYVLLNSDIEVTPDWIDPVISLMDKNENIAACQPKIRAYHKQEEFEYAGAAGGFIDKYGYPFCRGRIFNTLENDNGQYDDEAEIFWATGACMFVRAKVFHELGGFDNDFFAHMEEIDFCWRAKNAGHLIKYCPKSTVYHVGGGTLPKKNPRKTFYNFRNNLSLLYKNIPKGRVAEVLFVKTILDGIAAIKFMLDGNVKDSWAVVKAHAAFYSKLSALKEKRKKLVQQKVSKIYQKSIVSAYYLKKKQKFPELSPSDFS